MECQETQPFVSALYDGERVPAEAAEHINGCLACRDRLMDYAKVGAELRLVANRDAQLVTIPAWLPTTSPRRSFISLQALTGRVLVPRFALGLGAIVILALSIGLSLVRAQSKGLWFQFQLAPSDWPTPTTSTAAQAGYGAGPAVWFIVVAAKTGEPGHKVVGAMFSITEIQAARVRLNIRARRYDSLFRDGSLVTRAVKQDLSDLHGHEYVYLPGQSLEIPIDGGGSLILKGQVFDQKPQLVFGYPLQPGPGQMVLTHPALIRDDDTSPPEGRKQILLCSLNNQSEATSAEDEAFFIYAPGEGLFTLALRPFEDAIQGYVEGGEISFRFDGHPYFLHSVSPIAGETHTVWVSRNSKYLPPYHPDHAFIYSGKLPVAPNGLPGTSNTPRR